MSPSVEPEEKGLSELRDIQRRRNDALYISKAFPDLALSTSHNPRFLRILNRVLDSEMVTNLLMSMGNCVYMLLRVVGKPLRLCFMKTIEVSKVLPSRDLR